MVDDVVDDDGLADDDAFDDDDDDDGDAPRLPSFFAPELAWRLLLWFGEVLARSVGLFVEDCLWEEEVMVEP